MASVRLIINGESRDMNNARTLTELLIALEMSGRFAIEVNGEIVPRGRYPDFQLSGNDTIEIVRAIGGG